MILSHWLYLDFIQATTPTLPVVATTTTNPQQQEEEECIDTPNFLDLYGGGCDLYALPGTEAWCGAYVNVGDVGMTLIEYCCVCYGGLDGSGK